MSVRVDNQVISLDGDCDLGDAERLVAAISEGRDRVVDVSQCRGMHGAVLQALLSLRAPTVGEPADPFLRNLVIPGLRQASQEGENDR